MGQENVNEIPQPDGKKDLRVEYFTFLSDFKDFMDEFYRESVYELSIAEVSVKGQMQLFDGKTPGRVKLKNQGEIKCYLGTGKMGGYCLAPQESVQFYINRPLYVTTISGSTTLGFIRG